MRHQVIGQTEKKRATGTKRNHSLISYRATVQASSCIVVLAELCCASLPLTQTERYQENKLGEILYYADCHNVFEGTVYYSTVSLSDLIGKISHHSVILPKTYVHYAQLLYIIYFNNPESHDYLSFWFGKLRSSKQNL